MSSDKRKHLTYFCGVFVLPLRSLKLYSIWAYLYTGIPLVCLILIYIQGDSFNKDKRVYGTNYLFRAAVTQIGLGANIAQEALYPIAFTDSQGKPLTGTNNYIIHFNPGQTPPVNAFWSITMYNNKSLFVDNPINRYSIGT